MPPIHPTLRLPAHRPGIAFIALVSVATLALAIPAAQAAPTIDGNLTDLIDFANSLKSSGSGYGVAIPDNPDANYNPTPEKIYTDLKVIPCPQPQPAAGTHWVNGFEIFNHYLAYVPGSTKLYLGIRAEGIIGDDDGDGNPDVAGDGGANCNPNDNIEDRPGIAGRDIIAWAFDLNCDGLIDAGLKITDNVLSGSGLLTGATGTFAFRKDAATGATGHDLEVEVDLPAPLPATFRYVHVEAGAADGLTEDRSDGAAFFANPGIRVTKFREPATICTLGKARFTITVENTGTAPLSVVATDLLPDVLTFVEGVSSTCGATAQVQGSTVQWGPFDLAAGTTCSIVFDAQAGAACTGQVTNAVDVVGTYTSPCLPDGEVTVTDHAEVNINCGASSSCVEARAEGSSGCPGDEITLTGFAKNCSANSVEDITLIILGRNFQFNGVPPGEEVSQSWTTSTVCTPGAPVTYDVLAIATNECGDSQSRASWTFDCQAPPRLEITNTAEPAGPVDPGTVVHYTITVTNPSTNVMLEDVMVTDSLCDEVAYLPNPDDRVVYWAPGSYGEMMPGESDTLTFDAVVRTLASPDCERTDRSCTNRAVATVYWCGAERPVTAEHTTPINSCVQPGLCRLTGGGCLNEDGGTKGHKQSTFGGNASPAHDGGGPTGNSWEHVYRDGKAILFNWHSWDAHVIQCSVVPPGPCQPAADNTRADFVGTGKYSLGAGGREEDGNMVAYAIDHAEGACNRGIHDEYGIVVRAGLEIGKGAVVFQTSGEIDCGNLQIHETPASILGGGTSLPANEAGNVTSVALLNRAYPNPFSGSTNFAYKVAEGGASVDVGVYNVAGRLVKTLASGAQGAGTYTITWDGSDDAGVRMAPGVYFLKSHVGNDSTVSRVIYVAK